MREADDSAAICHEWESVASRHDFAFAARSPYAFKYATTADEIEQVCRLNFETFVREIPQHRDPGGERLVDKFHHKNTYIVAKVGCDVVGMISAHGRPPFSIEDRLTDASVLERLGGRPLEVRLLAVMPGYRRGSVFAGLMGALYEHARLRSHTRILISGVAERVSIYRRLGFQSLGPAVVCGQSSFVPMTLDLTVPNETGRRLIERWAGLRDRDHRGKNALVCLLPGPVEISNEVREALARPPISHRGAEFTARFERARDILSTLAGGKSRAALFCGSGTLANDVVASTMASFANSGTVLIPVNGEFGSRLANHATQAGLTSRVLRQSWGRPWDLAAIEEALEVDRSIRWVWGVHLETSTGMLNDVIGLKRLVDRAGVKLCLDAVSSLGAVSLDLNGVHLASAASGKALGAFAGLGIVFASPEIVATPRSGGIPPYLDLRSAIETKGTRFTIPSPLLAALEQALSAYDTGERRAARFAHYATLGRFVRRRLKLLGIEPVGDDEVSAPVVTSFPVPGVSLDRFAAHCRSLGFEIAHESDYLRSRSWAQIATMGDLDEPALLPLFEGLANGLPMLRDEKPNHSESTNSRQSQG